MSVKMWTKTLQGLKKTSLIKKGYFASHMSIDSIPEYEVPKPQKKVCVSSTFSQNHYSIGNLNYISNKNVCTTYQTNLMQSVSSLGIHTIRTFSSSSNFKDKNEANTGIDKSSSSPGIISSVLKDPEAENKQSESSEKKSDSDNEEKENKDDKKEESPFLKSQRMSKWVLLGMTGITTPLLLYFYGPPQYDEKGNPIEDEFSSSPLIIAYSKRAWNEIKMAKKEVVEPYSQKLLPDPLEEPYYQPPYTVVIELFDVLLRPVYDQVSGWRFKKRPGIEYFLSQVGPPLYEIVIFTKETGLTAYPLIDSMDSKGYIMYRLFRDAARYKSGFSLGNPIKGEMPSLDPYYEKDLRYLNRDLNRVIQIDCDKRAMETQPSNGLCLKPWDGSSTDTSLYDLAAFLRTVATSEVDDVRPVLEHYSKYEDPLSAFKLAQTRMQEEQEKLNEELQEKSKKPASFGTSSVLNFFSR